MRVQDPKSWQIKAKSNGTILEGKSIGLDPKKRAQSGAHDLENQDASYGPRQGFQFASNESKLVLRNLDPETHLKCALMKG